MPNNLLAWIQMSENNRTGFEDGSTFHFVSRIDMPERLGRIHHAEVVDGSPVYNFGQGDSGKHRKSLWKQGPGQGAG